MNIATSYKHSFCPTTKIAAFSIFVLYYQIKVLVKVKQYDSVKKKLSPCHLGNFLHFQFRAKYMIFSFKFFFCVQDCITKSLSYGFGLEKG